MTDLDMATRKFKEAMEADKRATKRLGEFYRGHYENRSGLSHEEFVNRKSKGKYAWK